MSGVKRVFVEKKKPYAVKAKELYDEITDYLGIKTVTGVRVLIRYDIENLSDDTYKKALTTVFSEPPVDDVYEMQFESGSDDYVFSVEYLPGQFDQRADSAEQCVKFFNENEIPVIKTATTYVISGTLTDEQKEKIKELCINPVDSREADSKIPDTLVTEFKVPADVIIFDGFKDIINALGGIDVDSECAFSAKGYSYSQGINYNMNGDKALVFARERKSFARGDVQRGKNQMSVIKGVISKCASPSILDNYQKILESISESFQTSVSKKNIQKFVKFQLANGYEWNIQSYNVSGSGQSNYTYSVPSNRAYVMVPNEETVAKAKEWLKIVTDGGELKDVTEEN